MHIVGIWYFLVVVVKRLKRVINWNKNENGNKKIETLRSELNQIQEQSIQIRERKASSGATIEGLQKRKGDLLDRISSELNLNEEK